MAENDQKRGKGVYMQQYPDLYRKDPAGTFRFLKDPGYLLIKKHIVTKTHVHM